ncbi:MAG: diheme cytochrome c [Actinomycetota bacterium]
MTIRIRTAALILAALASLPALGDGAKRFPVNGTYKEECGSCHVAYPPQLLSASAWQSVMARLDRHFGMDASLDAAKAQEIGRFLAANAGGQERFDPGADPRITATPWFRRKHRDGHDGLSAAIWKSPAVKSPANCEACHRSAAQGAYGEDDIRLPAR